jgi:hypothetical protein
MNRADTPFPRRWLVYIALKVAFIALLVALALKYVGYW